MSNSDYFCNFAASHSTPWAVCSSCHASGSRTNGALTAKSIGSWSGRIVKIPDSLSVPADKLSCFTALALTLHLTG